MKEIRRLIDKWIVILIVIMCIVSSVLFYQLNKSITIDNNDLSSRTVYSYYNDLLHGYREYLESMDEAEAKKYARADVYVIKNIIQWNNIKEKDEESYNASGYEERIQHYKQEFPQIYAHYQELKDNNETALNKYQNESLEIDAALKMYDNTFAYTNDYKDMVDSYIAQADNMLSVDINSDRDSFSHINLLKTKHDFRSLYSISVQPDNSKAITAVEEAGLYINIFILFIIIVTIFRFFDDRKNGLKYIIYSSADGRGKLAVSRVAALILVDIISTIIIYACEYIIAFSIYGGLSDINNPLQSCESYATICFTNVKLIYIFYMIFLSFLGMLVTGLIIWSFLTVCNNAGTGMGISLIVLFISYNAYMFIDNKSSWKILSIINIWNIILPFKMINSYGNVGFCGIIEDKWKFVLFIDIILGIIFISICIILNIKIKTVRKLSIVDKLTSRLNIIEQKILSHFPQLLMELYKLFWLRKGIIVIFILVIISGNVKIKKGYTYNDDYIISMNYYNEAEGMSLSDDLLKIVDKYENEQEYWENRLIDIRRHINDDIKIYSKEDLSEAGIQVELYKTGLNEIHRNVDNLIKNSERGVEGRVTIPFSVEEIFGQKLFTNQCFNGLLCVIGVILLLFGLFSEEKKHNMKVIIRTSTQGRRKWVIIKMITAVISTIIIWAVIFIPNIVNITDKYKVIGLGTYIQDYPLLSDVPVVMSVDTYILLTLFFKLMYLIAFTGIIVLISSYFEYLKSLAVSFSLIITHVLYLIGFDSLYCMSIVSPMLYTQKKILDDNKIVGGVFFLAGIVCWIIAWHHEVIKNK